jgi:hypothetical protein
MTKKHDSPGSSGGKGHMRQWASPSYDPTDGRSVSSVDEQGSREHVFSGNHATGHAQIPSGFGHLDKRRTQDATPVHRRPLTKVHE